MAEWTSRSVDWEKVKTLGELLEREGHLEENIAQHADQEKTVSHVRQQLIEAKNLRHAVQSQVIGENPNVAFWCQAKHSIKTWVNLKEMLNNARGNQEETLRIAPLVKQAEQQVGNALVLVRIPPTKKVDCPRCETDMKGLIERFGLSPQSLNTSESQEKVISLGSNPKRGVKMVDLMDALAINGGQALGKVAILLGKLMDTKVVAPVVKPSTLVPVLGLAIQAASLFVPGADRMPKTQLTGLTMGSHMLISPLVEMGAKALAPEMFGMSFKRSLQLPEARHMQMTKQFIPEEAHLLVSEPM